MPITKNILLQKTYEWREKIANKKVNRDIIVSEETDQDIL
jgi:hypothetical protein